jgi:superkiller protein 3
VFSKSRNVTASPEAEQAFLKAVKLVPDESNYWFRLGVARIGLQKHEEAIAASREVIKLQPDFADAYYTWGIALQRQNYLDQAIEAYRKAIELQPNFANAYSNLGWIYLLKGDLIQAKQELEIAINLDDQNHAPVLNLGLVYALENDKDAAKLQWQKGLILCQDEDDCEKTLPPLYRVALGETEQGIVEMQSVIQAGASVGALQNALEDAEILARCPVKPAEIDRVVEMLKAAVQSV